MSQDDATREPSAQTLRCAECGERIRPGRAPGTYTHVARLVAACDLDSDHRAAPAPAGSAPGGEPPPADRS